MYIILIITNAADPSSFNQTLVLLENAEENIPNR